MQFLIVAASKNRPGINPDTGTPWRDATGVFLPGMRQCGAWLRSLGHDVVGASIDNSQAPSAIRRDVRDVIEDIVPDRLVVLCHGLRGSVQLLGGPLAIPSLVQVLPPNLRFISLLACLSGATNGYAEALSKAAGGIAVLGHPTVGHAFRNPRVVTYWNGTSREDTHTPAQMAAADRWKYLCGPGLVAS